jgi:uronate dehydrogenase
MKRREFLQQTGAAVAGSAAALAVTSSRSGRAAERAAAARTVLVTSAETEFARQVAAALTDRHPVRLTGAQPVATDLPFTACELDAGEATQQLVRDVASIVHVGPAAAPDAERSLVDVWPRRTYHFLQAAVAAGVRRVVYLSSLQLVDGYEPAYLVDEDFCPLAPPGRGLLPLHLGEFCCREFARTGRLQVVVLRLGQVVDPQSVPLHAADAGWVDLRDAIQAVRLALETDTISDGRGIDTWSVFHIVSRADDPRFPISRAQRILGYEPKFGG